MDSQKKGNVIENSAGIAVFTTEALVKERLKQEQRSSATNVITVLTTLAKERILGDTFKSSMTERQDQKCEEGKIRMALSLKEPNTGERQRMQTI